MKAEYQGNEGFLQRDSVEHKGYAEARSTDCREGKERDGASDLLEAILGRDNLNSAHKRVKRNHGAAGIDGMTVEEALPWLKEHRGELLQSIRDGSYMPSPVRRKEIPKPDGSVRKLGIPTVVDRVIQQAIAQKLQSIWEPLFSDSSYGYRPKRSAQQAIQKVKKYAEEEYRYAVSVDLSKYFDTLNHELLMTLLHRQIQDMRVLRLIKKYLKSGVIMNFMDNQLLQIQNRTCHIYGTASAEYLLLQMVDEHDLAGMEREVEAIHRQTAQPFLLAAVQVENWNDDLSPWPAPPVWGKQGFGGRAGNTLAWLEQAVPGIRQQYSIKEDCKVILGGYSLAGLFALWAATQTNALYGTAAASPSVWFPGWPEYEAAHPIQAQRVYLSLGDREEHTKNQPMAAVGDNIRALHSTLTRCGRDCRLEWNAGGHFKDADLRTARAFAWVMEGKQ